MTSFRIELPVAPGVVHLVDSEGSAAAFVSWVDGLPAGETVALDVEATGLDMFSRSWRLRTVQFSDSVTAWVLPADFRAEIVHGLRGCSSFVAHNRTFDLMALERAGFDVSGLWASCGDSMVLAHLLDSRPKGVGPGVGLTSLAKSRLHTSAAGEAEESLKTWCKENGVPVADRYARVPLDVLAPYAGLDVLVTRRLSDSLGAELASVPRQRDLVDFEHEVQEVCAAMTRRGFLVDSAYGEALGEHYERVEESAADELRECWGVANPNSSRQVAEALQREGVALTERTASGAVSVSKSALASVDHRIADAVGEFRAASKFRAAYVDSVLEAAAAGDGRAHAAIRSMGARTARMSISDPPLQQLPAGDSLVRRMFVADPGKVVCAVDFSQVELRVLAALAGEPNMISAIVAGEDLHTATAERVGVSRKVAKSTNFLVVYGGGARALSATAGISVSEAKAAIDGFYRAYPRVRAYAERLQTDTDWGALPLVTVSGRRLRLDRDRSFAAVNYAVQSTARDLFASRMLEVAGSVPGAELLLPVHDELVFQADEAAADEVVSQVVGAMSCDFLGVPITCDGEVYGASWGHGYGDEFQSLSHRWATVSGHE